MSLIKLNVSANKMNWKDWYKGWIEEWRFQARLNEILVAESLGIEQNSEEIIAFFERAEELNIDLTKGEIG